MLEKPMMIRYYEEIPPADTLVVLVVGF